MMEKVMEEENQFDYQEPAFLQPSGPISNTTVVIGLLNGMIGGTIPVMPLMGLEAGYMTSILTCTTMGLISYFTAYLIILHLGKGRNIKDCVMAHFNHDYRYMVGYSFFIWFSFVPIFMIYFRLVCLQIEGLMGYHVNWLGPAVAVALIILIIVIRVSHVGEETLAFGAISFVFYFILLIWTHFTAPKGDKTVPMFDEPFSLASTLIMAYSIHDFLIQNIIKNPNRHEYQKMVIQTFTFGTLSYTFIALSSFALVNRQRVKAHPETINDFFSPGDWQITAIESIYMIHLLSAFPNFMVVSKIRFFQMFKIELQPDIKWQEVLYIIMMVLMSLIVYLSGVHLETLVIINGAIVGFTYVILIPIWLHLKCLLYDNSCGYIEGDEERNALVKLNACECNKSYSSRFTFYLEIVVSIVIIIVGVVLMVSTLWSLSKAKKLHG